MFRHLSPLLGVVRSASLNSSLAPSSRHGRGGAYRGLGRPRPRAAKAGLARSDRARGGASPRADCRLSPGGAERSGDNLPACRRVGKLKKGGNKRRGGNRRGERDGIRGAGPGRAGARMAGFPRYRAVQLFHLDASCGTGPAGPAGAGVGGVGALEAEPRRRSACTRPASGAGAELGVPICSAGRGGPAVMVKARSASPPRRPALHATHATPVIALPASGPSGASGLAL